MTIMVISPVIVLAAIATAAAQVAAPPAPPPPTVPPPPIVSTGPSTAYQPPRQVLAAWTMGEASCGGEAVTVAHRVSPMLLLGYANTYDRIEPVTAVFRIAADGRALGIRRLGNQYVYGGDDIAPSLAATRFASGAARDDCRVTYTIRRTPLDEAPLADVRAFAIAPNQQPGREVFRRTFPAGNDCFDPAPEVRLRGFPPFEALPRRPGALGWSMVQFDIDKAGKPVRLTTVDGTRDAALDRASLKAVAESRFAPGARHGCVYPYYIRPATLAPPEPPATATLRLEGATCPLEQEWATKPVLVYPSNYNRRTIEGWAVVAFDVAPWGATGNVRVLTAEPAADFGDAAMNVIRAATKAKSTTGYVGCVERVRYRIEQDGEAKPRAEVAPPPF